jgi:hypothetical protein
MEIPIILFYCQKYGVIFLAFLSINIWCYFFCSWYGVVLYIRFIWQLLHCFLSFCFTNSSVLALVILPFFYCRFQKTAEISLSYSAATVCVLMRKWMDSCYHGVLPGGLGSVLWVFPMYFSDSLVTEAWQFCSIHVLLSV